MKAKGKELKGMYKEMQPESLMMSYGYDPGLSEGSIKPPVFLTSTFVFKTAQEGKHFFELAYGLKEKESDDPELGLIYSRLNNPCLEIVEDRLSIWDNADASAIFSSGMAAISTVMFTFLKPGSAVLFLEPAYGGTEYLIKNILPSFDIHIISAKAGQGEEELEEVIQKSGHKESLALIYLETPANPTNTLTDIRMLSELAAKHSQDKPKIPLVTDNTFLGPIWQQPLNCGADLVIYSATKYIGGHSDLIAGVVSGSESYMKPVMTTRTFMGNMASPHTGWLLLRSLETLKVRMKAQVENAGKIAEYLKAHPKVERLYFLGDLPEGSYQSDIFKKQCSAPGSMIAFDIQGGEEEAFRFLNALSLFKLAVSLGGTESLAEHPATMTHSDIPESEQRQMGIKENMIRLSIGIEHSDDLIRVLDHAFKQI